MSEHIDPFADNQDDGPVAPESTDEQTKHQVAALLNRLQRIRRTHIPVPEYDYQQLRSEYEKQANADIQKLQQDTRLQRVQKLIAQADLNPDWLFERMDHSDPILEHAIQTAHSFISGFEHWEQHGGSCILIYGDYGSGKSTLAGAIAHELIAQRQKSVIFQQWASIIDRLFFAVIEDQEERNRYRRALEEVDLLIIDEIGANKTRMVESQSSFLGHLLRRRRNLSKSVILITNHNPASLHQAVGDFCFEAIKAFNPVDIHLTGPSRRPRIGNYGG
ncbi:MAG: AAA family ATPase [Gammaproteobacteria bacterium]|nr:AAA family ATPase [Gammaproteobacteria bacterium]